MNGQLKSRKTVAGLALAGILGASVGAFVAGVLPVTPQVSERGAQAATDRLNGQAEAYHQARVDSAWTLRLTGIARQRADQAATDRLNAQADALGLRGMSDRAAQAWTDRLNGMADAYAAK
jgi:hypothetical protein